MAGNYVEILVKSRDEAKPDLDDLKAKLEELSHKVAEARVEVEDAGDAAKLDRMAAKLDELNHKTSNPKIRVAGALRAEADIHLVEASLDNLNRKEDEAAVKTSLLGGAFDSIGNSIGGALDKSVPFVGSVQTLGLMAPAIGALAVEIVGVAAGFAAAGAGAGAFALLAMPAIKQVETAYSGLGAAQQKYQAALALEKLDPTKAHAAAVTAALDQLKLAQESISKLPASEQAAIKGLSDLRAEFGKMSAAFAPAAFKVFADGLKVVDNLLPHLVPFANTFATVLDGLLKQADKFTASKGFSDWLKQFQSLEGPALNSIGQGIGRVAVAIGKLLTSVSGKDAAHALNILFDGLAGTINVVTSAISRFMSNWDSMSKTASRDAHDVASSFDAVRSGVAKMASGVGSAISSAVSHVATFVSDVAHDTAQVVTFFLELPGKMVAALGNLGGLLFNAGYQIIMGLLHGLESAWNAVTGFISGIAGWIASHKGPLDYDRQLLVPHGKAIMQGLMDGMQSKIPDLRSQLGDVSSMIGGLGVNGGGAGGGALRLQVLPGGGSAFEAFMVQAIRNYVRVRGGNVQSAFGH